jgi:hypothetical protein
MFVPNNSSRRRLKNLLSVQGDDNLIETYTQVCIGSYGSRSPPSITLVMQDYPRSCFQYYFLDIGHRSVLI